MLGRLRPKRERRLLPRRSKLHRPEVERTIAFTANLAARLYTPRGAVDYRSMPQDAPDRRREGPRAPSSPSGPTAPNGREDRIFTSAQTPIPLETEIDPSSPKPRGERRRGVLTKMLNARTDSRALHDLSGRVYLLLGLLALFLSAGLAGLSFVVYGEEMGPHIFATIIGILGEAALVVLVLDRMANSQKRREWRFVGSVVSHGVAACMVDLTRLYGTKWSSESYHYNSARYGEFMQTLRMDLANLQSNLEGLALGAKPEVYEQARKIERRVTWMANYLNDKPASATRPRQWELEIIVSTMKLAGKFMQATVAAEFKENLIKAGEAVVNLRRIENLEESDVAADEFWGMRMDSQDKLLSLYPSLKPETLRREQSFGLGIWYDIDQTLAPFYFAIDYILFDRISDGALTTRL